MGWRSKNDGAMPIVTPLSCATSCAALAIIWARLPIPSLKVLALIRISGEAIVIPHSCADIESLILLFYSSVIMKIWACANCLYQLFFQAANIMAGSDSSENIQFY